MNKLWISVVVLLTAGLAIVACQVQAVPAPEPSVANAAFATPSPSVSKQPSTPQPVYGGTLRYIFPASPQSLSYGPEMAVWEAIMIAPAVERLMDVGEQRNVNYALKPVLAERVDEDIANNRIIFHLRQGIKFHDGSPLNAEAVIWNYQQLLTLGGLQYIGYWKGIDKLDDLTFQITYTEYCNQLVPSWGAIFIFSKTAWEKASAGDLAKGRDWARNNAVGTGPFMLKELKRDQHLLWVKNPDYWQPGKPYLDAYEILFVADSMTAQMVMQRGEADQWIGVPVKSQAELEQQGLIRRSGWYGTPYAIWPNTANPDSKWNDIRLRQALEYALDKPAIAKAMGYDYFKPLMTMAPQGEWGYDPGYPARNYNPEKARQLLNEAGYAEGLPAKLLMSSGGESRTIGALLKHYLEAAGFNIDLDIADIGRYMASLRGPTVSSGDLAWIGSGMDNTYLASYMRYFSTTPIGDNSYLGHTQEQKTLDKMALKITDAPGQQAVTQKLINYLADNALIIPVYWVPGVIMCAPYVHQKISLGALRFPAEDAWMDKH
jgi:peptide/nickel transport system substrate-binding protein